MPISKPHSSFASKNKDNCIKLAQYLEKETIEIDQMIKDEVSKHRRDLLETMKQSFFTSKETNVGIIEVVDSIDKNISKLGKKDAKFFAPTISFSKNEQQHLINRITNKNDVNSVFDLTPKEFTHYNNLLIKYAREVMDNYATNFNRQHKGLMDGSDLLYFGRIEHFRKYKGIDKEVKTGNSKTGDYKPGLQSHIHIIVSRKDATQKMKLDPTTKERLTKRKIGNNAYTVGFNRNNWIKLNEESFDKLFNYKRPKLQKFEVQNTLKNGTPIEIDKILMSVNSLTPNDHQEDLRKKKKKKRLL